MRTKTTRELWPSVDDAALDAILALRAVWELAHRGAALEPDGPSRVSLARLGLDARVHAVALTGVCETHHRFVVEWTGRVVESLPLVVHCPVLLQDSRPCGTRSPVWNAELAEGRAA